MKKLTSKMILSLLLLVSGWIGTNAQSTLESEVPGDNFSLEGALELFKKSASPEEFEKMLNSSDSKVNNLDLNNDGNIDYVRVIDRNEGNVHAFILQAVLSDTDNQDVAVIELEKLEDGKAVLQITGDADVYGIETIIEPTEEVRVNAGATTSRAVVNVWAWPSVQYVYTPYYSPWMSPWSWAYHPIWWRPWVPVAFYVYDPWWRPYRPYYSSCYSHRVYFAPGLYRPYRTTSIIVHNNYHHQIDRYRSRYDNGHGGRRDGYNGRRNDGDRYGNNGRSRSDYGTRDNNYSGRRSDNNTYGNRDQYRSDGNRSNTRQRESMEHSRTAPQGNSNRHLSPSVRSERSDRSSNFRQTNSGERRIAGQTSQPQQRQSHSSLNMGSRQQHSSPSPSINRSSPGRSSMSGGSHGGGSRGNSNGGGGSRSHRSRN